MYVKATGQISINCLKLCSCIVDAMKALGKSTLLTKRNDERCTINTKKIQCNLQVNYMQQFKIFDTVSTMKKNYVSSITISMVIVSTNSLLTLTFSLATGFSCFAEHLRSTFAFNWNFLENTNIHSLHFHIVLKLFIQTLICVLILIALILIRYDILNSFLSAFLMNENVLRRYLKLFIIKKYSYSTFLSIISLSL